MIPDTVVGELLLESLLIKSCNATECGVLIDGFPRTSLQVCGCACVLIGRRTRSLLQLSAMPMLLYKNHLVAVAVTGSADICMCS